MLDSIRFEGGRQGGRRAGRGIEGRGTLFKATPPRKVHQAIRDELKLGQKCIGGVLV